MLGLIVAFWVGMMIGAVVTYFIKEYFLHCLLLELSECERWVYENGELVVIHRSSR